MRDCEFFYSDHRRSLIDTNLQQKVINLAASFYKDVALYIYPKPDTKYLTKYSGHLLSVDLALLDSEYPFNYFGIIPLNENRVDEMGQFVFDRTPGGRLVRFLKLPISFNVQPSDDSYLNEKEEVVIKRGAYMRIPHDSRASRFALLLYIIKLRWWPDFFFRDNSRIYSEICDIIFDSGLDTIFRDESLDYESCWNIYDKECARRYPIPPPEVAQITLDSLPFSVRPSECFQRASIKTLGDLVRYSARDLRQLPFFGPNSVNQTKDILKDFGLSLRPE